jgi:hypothetical protein
MKIYRDYAKFRDAYPKLPMGATLENDGIQIFRRVVYCFDVNEAVGFRTARQHLREFTITWLRSQNKNLKLEAIFLRTRRISFYDVESTAIIVGKYQ